MFLKVITMEIFFFEHKHFLAAFANLQHACFFPIPTFLLQLPSLYSYLPYLCFRQFSFHWAKCVTKDHIVTDLLRYDPVKNLISVSDNALLQVTWRS